MSLEEAKFAFAEWIKRKNWVIVFTSLSILVALGIIMTVFTHMHVRQANEDRDQQLQMVDEMEWHFIVSVLNDNYDLAKNNADHIRSAIAARVQQEYKDDVVRLRNDLDHPTPTAILYTILDEEIEGQFINRKSDANDPFIITKDGIVSDKSIDCQPIDRNGKGIRTWDAEYRLAANPVLAKAAITAILNQSKEPIFWEFSANKTAKHAKITTMDLSEIRKVLIHEGIQALASYEFLSYSPVFEQRDLSGRALISPLSTKNPDVQVLYVVQGYNLVDALNKNHAPALAQFDKSRALIKANRDSQLGQKMGMYFLTFIALLVGIGGLSLAAQGCSKEAHNGCHYRDAHKIS